MYALDAATGHVRWAYTTRSGDSGPAVAGGTVYVGSNDDSRCTVTTASCTRWVPPPATSAGPTPPESRGSARRWLAAPSTSAAADGKVYALDAATGRVRWAYTTGSHVDSSPAVAGGTVYVGSDDGTVYALKAGS